MNNLPTLVYRRNDVRDSSSPYQYEPLKANHIRLLRLLPSRPQDEGIIECDILTTPLKDARPFAALSYAWGKQGQDQTLQVKSSFIFGRFKTTSIPITLTLFTALKYLRVENTPILLWADQICINQNDMQERSLQVDMMREIYEKAERTVVWLGDGDADTEIIKEMFDTLRTSGSQVESTAPASGNGSKPDPTILRILDQELLKSLLQGGEWQLTEMWWARREALIRFLGRNWFRRAWVYQETVVAAKVDIVWGSLRLPFEYVAGLILTSYSIFKSEDDGKWYELLKRTRGFGPLRSIWFDRQNHASVALASTSRSLDWERSRQNMGFLNILWRARKYLDATDHRDFVYSFLGFQDLEPQFQIHADYTVKMNDPKYPRAVEDTFIALARAAIAGSGDLNIFRCLALIKRSQYNLPSWVPNWAARPYKCGSTIVNPALKNEFKACRGKQHDFVDGNPAHLIVKGHLIARVRSVMERKIDYCFYQSRVSDAFELEDLAREVSRQSEALQEESPSRLRSRFRQYKDQEDLEKLLLRVLLADGVFSRNKQRLDDSFLGDLIKVHKDIAALSLGSSENEHELYAFLREAGTVAQDKKVFLSDRLELGLGYPNMKCGDVVCLIYGSNTPCILRKSSKMASGCYKLIGQCYLNGWMYGDNDWGVNWWEQEAETFILV